MGWVIPTKSPPPQATIKVHCQICAKEFEYGVCSGSGGYGPHRECCCKTCYEEFEWRRALMICNKPYQPREKKDFKHG